MPAEAFQDENGASSVLPGTILLEAYIRTETAPAHLTTAIRWRIRTFMSLFLLLIPSVKVFFHLCLILPHEESEDRVLGIDCLRDDE